VTTCVWRITDFGRKSAIRHTQVNGVGPREFSRSSNLTVSSVGAANSGWTNLALFSLMRGTRSRMEGRFGLLLRAVRASTQMS